MKRKITSLIIIFSLLTFVYFASVFAIDKPPFNPTPSKINLEKPSPYYSATKEWEDFQKMDENTIWDKMGIAPIL